MSLLEVHNSFQERSVGHVTNSHKNCLYRKDCLFSCHDVVENCASYDLSGWSVRSLYSLYQRGILSQNFIYSSIPKDSNFFVSNDALGEDARSTEGIASVDDRYRLAGSSQYQCVFHGRVTSSYNNHIFTKKSRSITGSARTDATTSHVVFTRNAEPLAIRPTSYYDGMGFDLRASLRKNFDGLRGRVNLHHHISFKESSKFDSLLSHLRHDSGPGVHVDAWKVLNVNALAL
mmetsp:Transcript_14198/g.31039  ORF Transcript_14198/g.31039 Transcript_14198/m.31039 type:complete len:232 (+) Transcript_14198:427-1122(+)